MAPDNKVDRWIRDNLFNAVPIAIAVMDKEFNVVYANHSFEKMFGNWKNRKCYAVYKNQKEVCKECKALATLKDGIPRISEEAGYNKEGRLTRYIKQTFPIIENGDILFLVEMSIDITDTERIRKERQLLFDQVPCNVMLIDKDFRVVRTNKKIREMFGDIEGTYCYESLKGTSRKCADCTAHQTFKDGKTHTGRSIVKGKDGKDINFQVTTVPLDVGDGQFELVMEMAVDITEMVNLQEELEDAHAFMQSLITTSMAGIIAVDHVGDITILNPAARDIFNIVPSKLITMQELEYMLPEGFLNQINAGPGHVHLPETDVQTIDGINVPVRLVGFQLSRGKSPMGMAIFIHDLRELKQLETDKIEAERLAAVGQTVAGLAHGVKNLITGLDGGMYMLNSGMNQGKVERIQEGMEMLGRNIERISKFVKEFLSFSRGREIQAELCHPSDIAEDVVSIYKTKANNFGVELIFEKKGDIKPAPIEYESMHECLTNLVGNAIDACMTSEDNDKCHVWVRVYEDDTNAIIFEVVDDGCGMDYEVKKKVFTNFFTTKGLGGTGLGLLTTKKIIQEHGGKISMESRLGKGTTFRIRLPRKQLPKIIEHNDEPKN